MYIGVNLMLRVPDHTVTISFGYILNCGCFNLFCNVWWCVYVWVLYCVLVLVIYISFVP
jgi:hypothetical protein